MVLPPKIFLNSGLLLIICAVVVALSGFTIGHVIVEAAYKGESLEFLNSFISGQENHPLESYLTDFDALVLTLIYVCLILGISLLLAHVLPSQLSSRIFLTLLILTPPLYLVLFVLKHHIDLPVADDWSMLVLVEKTIDGTLTFNDLWRQYNEYRLFFPRLILLPVARASAWNLTYEIIINLAIAAATFLAISLQVMRTAKRNGHELTPWIFPLLSVQVFSLMQWENWMMGFQTNYMLGAFAVIAAIVALDRPGKSLLCVFFAAWLGIVASYSSVNGLLVWPIGFAMLLFSSSALGTRKAGLLLTWSLVASVVVFLYLYGLEVNVDGTSIGAAAYTKFVVNYLGASFIKGHALTPLAGFLGLLFFAYFAYRVVRSGTLSIEDMLPYLAIALFAIMAAMLTGLGRLDHSPRAAHASRYTTISLWLWAAIAVFISFLSGSKKQSQKPYSGWDRLAIFSMIAVLFLGFLVNSYWTSRKAAVWWQEHHLRPARDHIMSVDKLEALDPTLVKRLTAGYATVEQTKARLSVLKRRKLAAFRKK